MIRILLVLLLVFLIGWVAWPAFSAYQIYGGMKSANEGTLLKKINWDSLRTSLRPVVAKAVEKQIGEFGGNGAAGAFGAQLQQQIAPQIIDVAMKTIVTPKGLIEVMAHGGDVTSSIGKVVSSQADKLGGLGNLTGGGNGGSNGGGGLLGGLLGNKEKSGGLGDLLGGLAADEKTRNAINGALGKAMGGDKPKPAVQEDKPAAPSYGLSNLKRFAYTGLGSLEVGVAKDPAASKPDVVAVMEFQDFDWKLTGLVPQLP